MVDHSLGERPDPPDPRRETPGHPVDPAVKSLNWQLGPFVLDPVSRALFHDNRPLPLGERAVSILMMLVERPHKPVSKDELIAFAWRGLAVEDSNLTVQVAALRRALALDPDGRSWIETLPRRGYRFVGPVMLPGASGGVQISSVALATGPLSGSAPATPERMDDEFTAIPLAKRIDYPSHPIVGRDAPLELLDQITQRMLGGTRQLAFVTGEAGVGKTAFLKMAAERSAERGVGLLYGRCTERFGADEAFLPLLDALVSRCRTSDGGELLAAIRTHAPTWLLQIPGVMDATERTAFQHEVFGATRERMLREFCDLLETLSVRRPWILILEDLHWSDVATLDVLSRFARGTCNAQMLIIGSYRSADGAVGGHPIRRLHQDLEIHGCCVELPLDRLSCAELERYLELRFGDAELASTLSVPVFERTQGHPLFVTSMLRYLIDQKTIVESDGAWRLSSQARESQGAVPADLLKMITYELERLTEHERRLLDVASVAGEEFSAALVAAGLSRDVVEVEQEIEAHARKAHILVRSGVSEWPDGTYSGMYSFRHILYQNVIYQHLAPGARAQTHKRLGKRLEEAYADRTTEIAAALALHFEQGRDFAGALRYLGQAAESSTKRLGHAEATSYLTRALGILDRFDAPEGVGLRIGLLRQRSLALRSCGDIAGSIHDLKELTASAKRSGKLKQEISGLLAVSQFCLYTDRRVCLQATEDALNRSQALEEGTFKVQVQGAIASVNLAVKGWRDQDAELCVRATDLSAGARDHGTLIRHHVMEGILDCLRSRYQECRRAGTHGKRLAREAGDIYVFALLNVLESIALIYLGEWRDLQRETTTALELAERNANEPASALCRLTLAWLHVEAMDFDGARELCECVDEKIFKEDQRAFFFHRVVLAKAFVGLGKPQRASEQFNDIWRQMDEDDVLLDFAISMQLYYCLGEYYLQIGDLAQARKWAGQLHDFAAPAPDRNYLAHAHGMLARIAFASADFEQALAQLSCALAIVENADFPLASWRVYLAAAEIFSKCDEAGKASTCRAGFVDVLRRLISNFESDDPLNKSLSGVLTERITEWGFAA